MTVRSSTGEYEIVRAEPERLASLNHHFFITDEEVASRYASLLSQRCLILPPGEDTKSLTFFGRCLSWLAASGASRSSTVVAFGGGVIGDLAGFVAASYMRGISYIQIPTTLLAQVDSSVGGKVAIDLPEGKNLAGSFHPPAQVLLSGAFLKTLPERQIRNGMAEVLKYGFIARPDLLDRASNPAGLNAIVDECIAIKAKVVEDDEFETKGIRASLNFGHTIGHAIEATLGYSELLHGEAISVGMVAEARLGELIGVTQPGTAQFVEETLTRAGLPTVHSTLQDPQTLIRAMYRDKKAREGKLTFSLIPQIGDCKLVSGVSEEDVRLALSQ